MTVRILKYILLPFLLLTAMIVTDVIAASADLTASAVILSRNRCRFRGGSTPVLDFGNLDSTSGAVVNASTTVDFICRGSSPIAAFLISADDGLNSTGPGAKRVQHAVNGAQYIPYSITLSPTFGNIPRRTWQVLTIDGTINGPDYATAQIGAYTDTVVISILP